jgi:hypothetical protein
VFSGKNLMSAVSPFPKIIGYLSAYSESISAIICPTLKSDATSDLISMTLIVSFFILVLGTSVGGLIFVDYLATKYSFSLGLKRIFGVPSMDYLPPDDFLVFFVLSK